MSNARNLSKLKPSTVGLIESDDITDAAVTTVKMADAGVTPAKLSQKLIIETAQATTSGITKDFTGIPSWAKRITVILNGVSTNGVAQVGIQLGTSGGVETTGYSGAINDGFSGSVAYSNAFLDNSGSIASTRHFVYTLTLVGSNTWLCQVLGAFSNAAGGRFGGGSKALSGTLDRVRLMTNNGTDTFDAGSVNILYE